MRASTLGQPDHLARMRATTSGRADHLARMRATASGPPMRFAQLQQVQSVRRSGVSSCMGDTSEPWFRNVGGRLGAGVCASLAEHLKLNPVFVRVAFVVSLLFTGGLACWVYLAFWALTPFDRGGRSFAQRVFGAMGPFFTSSIGPEQHQHTGSVPSDEHGNVRPVE